MTRLGLVAILSVAAVLAAPWAGAQSEFIAPRPLTPSATFEHTPPPGSSYTTVVVHLISMTQPTDYPPTLVEIDGSGRFTFEATCDFVGPGILRIVSADNPTDILEELPIVCAEDPGAPVQLLAAALTDATPPQTIPGVLDAYTVQTSTTLSRTYRNTRVSDGAIVDEIIYSSNFTDTLALANGVFCATLIGTGQYCRRGICQARLCVDEVGLSCGNSPANSNTCTPSPSGLPSSGSLTVRTGTRHKTFEQTATVAHSTDTYDEAHTGSLQMIWRFPALPVGSRIATIIITGQGMRMTSPTNVFAMRTLGAAGSPPPQPPSVRVDATGPFLSFCPEGLFSDEVIWQLPGPPTGNTVTVQTDPTADCPAEKTSSGTTPDGVQFAETLTSNQSGMQGTFSAAGVPDDPFFDIRLATFIPANHVPGPATSVCAPAGTVTPLQLSFEGDDRSFDAESTKYRTLQEVTIVTEASADSDSNGIKDGTSIHKDIGVSRSYAPDATIDGVITEADRDGVFYDCILEQEQGRALLSEHNVEVSRVDAHSVRVRLHGAASNPIVVGSWLAAINWDITLVISRGEDATTYRIEKGCHDPFPAYELYIDKKPIHLFGPTDPQGTSSLFRHCNLEVPQKSGVL